MRHQPHQRRSPTQWQRLIEQQAASGLSQVAFCASQGLAKSSFQHWKRRLKSSAPAGLLQSPGDAMFTPLPETPGAPSREATPDDGWAIELDLGDGVCLRFRRGGL